MVLLSAARQPAPLQCCDLPPGIRVFAYPFELPEIARLLPSQSSPATGSVSDGKYCEFIDPEGVPAYFACRALIEALVQAEIHGRGMARLRWVACDRFDYPEDANTLYREFEDERGPAMAATGAVRVLLGHGHPTRALELLQSAQATGITGAAVTACEARVLLACGRVSESVAAAARALRSLPDPLWMEADHHYSWGILYGAAQASTLEPALREDLFTVIHSLYAAAPSAKRALACGGLFEAARSATDAASCAETALHLATDDPAVRADATAMLARVREGLGEIALESVSGGPIERATLDVGPPYDGPDLGDVRAVRNYCRRLAEARRSGLIEADVLQTVDGPAIQLVYKTFINPGMAFTGIQIVPVGDVTNVWTVTAEEESETGTREAMVTAHLMEQGELNIESYKSSWARDPYDSRYRGVEQPALRFMSDDPVYDRMFSRHPLTRVRRVLRQLAETESSARVTRL
jgi:hypothetical protein